LNLQLDTDVLIDFLRRPGAGPELFDRLVKPGTCMSVMTYGELWQGLLEHPRHDEQRVILEKLLGPMTILPLDESTMRQYAFLRSEMKRQGRLLPTPDLLIAATALHHNLTLVTRNRKHFDRIPSLNVASPEEA
jgi:predicted nucleic acid-binding protein